MSAASTANFKSPVANATIGKNVVIKGQIVIREDLPVQGQVEGTIEIGDNRLTIESDGAVSAEVSAREIEICGSMRGTIQAKEKVYVRAGAHIVGDIYAASIIVDEGAYIKGGIDLSASRDERSTAPWPTEVGDVDHRTAA